MKTTNSNLDSILIEIGEYGRYQRFISLLVVFVTIICYFSVVVYVFEATPVNHRCKIPKCDLEPTEYNTEWLINAVPFENGKPSRCTKFQHTNMFNCDSLSFNNTTQETCDTFVYETAQKSIMQDFNLHCDENLKTLTLVGTINGIGKFIGLPIAGYLSDKYGRKNILLWCMILSGLFGFMRSFTTSYTFFILCEILDSAFNTGGYATACVIGSELVGPTKRALLGTIQFLSYGFGSIILGCTAWLIQSWRILLRVLYGLYIVILSYYWLMPESIRWLLTKNRKTEAIKILRKVAKVNGKNISEEKLEKLLYSGRNQETLTIPIKDLFKSRILLGRCLICSFCWFSCIVVYYGLTVVSTTLSKNRYLNFVLTSAIESPANFIALYLLNKKGRKTTLLLALVLSSVSSIAYTVTPINIYWVQLLMYLISKFGITMSMASLYITTNEVFPTSLRQTMFSVCSMFGRVGNVLVPQLLLLVEVWKPLPLIVFGVLTGISSILTIGLPETKNITLPDSIQDAENIGRREANSIIENDTP